MTNIVKLASKTKCKVTGLNIENFLFKLSSANIGLYHVKKRKKYLYFTISSLNEQVVKDTALQIGVSLQFLGNTGLAKVVAKLPYSIGGILGLVVSAVYIYLCTNTITNIQYVIPQSHTCKNSNNCIYQKQNLDQIKLFINKNINTKKLAKKSFVGLQNDVVSNFELVKNCTIQKNGNTITVELTEATQKQNLQYKTIVAQTNCIITSITTYSGMAKVKAGDIVVAGQVLVEADGQAMPQADIYAKVWINGMALHNCNQSQIVYTGKKITTTNLKLFGLQIKSKKHIPYTYFVSKQHTSYITNMVLPITQTKTTYYEAQITTAYKPFDQCKEQVMEQAKLSAMQNLGDNKIEQITYSITTDGEITKVDCFLLTYQKIGQYM